MLCSPIIWFICTCTHIHWYSILLLVLQFRFQFQYPLLQIQFLLSILIQLLLPILHSQTSNPHFLLQSHSLLLIAELLFLLCHHLILQLTNSILQLSYLPIPSLQLWLQWIQFKLSLLHCTILLTLPQCNLLCQLPISQLLLIQCHLHPNVLLPQSLNLISTLIQFLLQLPTIIHLYLIIIIIFPPLLSILNLLMQ